jgi:hypothetical protein
MPVQVVVNKSAAELAVERQKAHGGMLVLLRRKEVEEVDGFTKGVAHGPEEFIFDAVPSEEVLLHGGRGHFCFSVSVEIVFLFLSKRTDCTIATPLLQSNLQSVYDRNKKTFRCFFCILSFVVEMNSRKTSKKNKNPTDGHVADGEENRRGRRPRRME